MTTDQLRSKQYREIQEMVDRHAIEMRELLEVIANNPPPRPTE